MPTLFNKVFFKRIHRLVVFVIFMAIMIACQPKKADTNRPLDGTTLHQVWSRDVGEPINHPPMQVFIQHARTALQKCNNLGWQLPPEYFKLEPAPYWIDLVFVPKIGAR